MYSGHPQLQGLYNATAAYVQFPTPTPRFDGDDLIRAEAAQLDTVVASVRQKWAESYDPVYDALGSGTSRKKGEVGNRLNKARAALGQVVELAHHATAGLTAWQLKAGLSCHPPPYVTVHSKEYAKLRNAQEEARLEGLRHCADLQRIADNAKAELQVRDDQFAVASADAAKREAAHQEEVKRLQDRIRTLTVDTKTFEGHLRDARALLTKHGLRGAPSTGTAPAASYAASVKGESRVATYPVPPVVPPPTVPDPGRVVPPPPGIAGPANPMVPFSAQQMVQGQAGPMAPWVIPHPHLEDHHWYLMDRRDVKRMFTPPRAIQKFLEHSGQPCMKE